MAERRWYWVVLACLLAGILASKPPYVLMALLPLLYADRVHRMRALAVAVSAFGTMLLWGTVGMHPVDITAVSGGAVDEKRQALRLFHHPWVAVELVVRTAMAFGAGLYQQYIGILGWLDASTPQWFYRFIGFAWGLGVCSALLQARFRFCIWAWGQRFGALAIVAATFCGVSLALYMIWTPVGQSLILGLQGRYYLGLSLFLALLLPEIPRHWGARIWRGVDAVLIVVVPFVCAIATYETLVLRYW